MFDVQTLNAISPRGLARLPKDKYRVSADVAEPHAIIVRSFNLHEREIPASVRAIGRAGAGVNNIPVDKMTARGVPVFNAPGANANAVKELVIAGLIVACRHLCEAWDFARRLDGTDAELHKHVEAGKKKFVGSEISGRTLSVIGLGAIGRNVANAAAGLGMHVTGFDPGLTVHRATQLSSAVRRVDSMDELLKGAEFITVHVPLSAQTRHLIGDSEIARMPATGVVLNFARQGIVDEASVVRALDAGKLAAYVSDFPTNQTKSHARCITFPHLGASTEEAEENCAIMVADQVRDFLEHGNVHNAVNFPEVSLARGGAARIVCAGESEPTTAGQVSETLRKAGLTIRGMANFSRDDLSYMIVDVDGTVPPDLCDAIRSIPGVAMARSV